mmetsp:Transcript_50166/g.116484  ORF Transcript_50166/g.116484 Transcript_50166/m.116484 type:complete len:310 (+) Transcript_50166:1604-2533(+)
MHRDLLVLPSRRIDILMNVHVASKGGDSVLLSAHLLGPSGLQVLLPEWLQGVETSQIQACRATMEHRCRQLFQDVTGFDRAIAVHCSKPDPSRLRHCGVILLPHEAVALVSAIRLCGAYALPPQLAAVRVFLVELHTVAIALLLTDLLATLNGLNFELLPVDSAATIRSAIVFIQAACHAIAKRGPNARRVPESCARGAPFLRLPAIESRRSLHGVVLAATIPAADGVSTVVLQYIAPIAPMIRSALAPSPKNRFATLKVEGVTFSTMDIQRPVTAVGAIDSETVRTAPRLPFEVQNGSCPYLTALLPS